MTTTLTAAPAPSASRLQEMVDQAAHFYVYSRQRPGPAVTPLRDGDRTVGFALDEIWYRLRAVTFGPAWLDACGRDEVGEELATVRQRWLFCPDGFEGKPDVLPPPTPFDPSRSQRFVMMGGRAAFDEVEGSFAIYGAGHTLPSRPGRPVLAQAGGATLGGSGAFEGFDEATLAYCGTLCPETGFAGNVLLRAMDRRERFRTDRLAPEFRSSGPGRDAARYYIFRGQASPSDPVSPRLGPDGRPAGLTVVQSLRGLEVDCWVRRHRGVAASDSFGPIIGTITAHVAFDPQAPGGGPLDPVPFTTFDEFHFHDPQGRRIGGFTADSREGRVFRTLVAGQPAIRFVGVGMIHEGDGVFAGIQGQLTDSSVVLFEPHVSASVYVLRVTGWR
jgi:hypothetical protein